MAGRVVAVVGASSDRGKFGNRAVRAFLRQGYDVRPVNPNEETIEGLPVYRTIADIPGPVDIVSLYVPAAIGIGLLEAIAAKQPGRCGSIPAPSRRRSKPGPAPSGSRRSTPARSSRSADRPDSTGRSSTGRLTGLPAGPILGPLAACRRRRPQPAPLDIRFHPQLILAVARHP